MFPFSETFSSSWNGFIIARELINCKHFYVKNFIPDYNFHLIFSVLYTVLISVKAVFGTTPSKTLKNICIYCSGQ
ncbi:hypothetical protein HMPREF9555_01720 [Selenomonas artemidis F0399]|uniref:Uncharacterized protein n=1 Tax=Selenomonas artemidis F0399 TaxID=749551 RepID=E7N3Y0_9FIRM|nr:hypothetical protein HMPREF9555_01720 [Selenomonas artemidis F0399]